MQAAEISWLRQNFGDAVVILFGRGWTGLAAPFLQEQHVHLERFNQCSLIVSKTLCDFSRFFISFKFFKVKAKTDVFEITGTYFLDIWAYF